MPSLNSSGNDKQWKHSMCTTGDLTATAAVCCRGPECTNQPSSPWWASPAASPPTPSPMGPESPFKLWLWPFPLFLNYAGGVLVSGSASALALPAHGPHGSGPPTCHLTFWLDLGLASWPWWCPVRWTLGCALLACLARLVWVLWDVPALPAGLRRLAPSPLRTTSLSPLGPDTHRCLTSPSAINLSTGSWWYFWLLSHSRYKRLNWY